MEDGFEVLEEDDHTTLFKNAGRYYFRATLGGMRLLHNAIAPEVFREFVRRAEERGARLVTVKLAELGDGQNAIVLEVDRAEDYQELRGLFYRCVVESSLSNPGVFLQVVNSELLRMPPQGFQRPQGGFQRNEC